MEQHHTGPLVMPATARRLERLAQQGVMNPRTLERALEIIGYVPSGARWLQFLDRSLLILGAGFAVSGVFYFLAFNWAALHRFVKLGLVASIMVVAVALASWYRLDTLPGKVAVGVAALLAGALLAVYGQSYQTGADAYQLFLTWAALISGWVLVARLAPLWLGWVALLNVGIVLYWAQVLDENEAGMYLCLFALDAAALVAWEVARGRGVAWLANRWFPRLLALPAFAALVVPTVNWLTYPGSVRGDALEGLLVTIPILLAVASAITIYVYSRPIPDLFMLLVCAAGLIVTLDTWLWERLRQVDAGLFLVGALLIVEAALVVAWLRRVSASWAK